jgi:quinoprotein glucose dehydrogenase
VEGTRYLPVAEIERGNVHLLEPAWAYRTREMEPAFATEEPTSFQSTPIAIDGVLYFNTPLGRVIALDAATGVELWVFDPGIRRDVTYGDHASRGVSSWLDAAAAPDDVCRRSIYVATPQSQLIRLDARGGAPCSAFASELFVPAALLQSGVNQAAP